MGVKELSLVAMQCAALYYASCEEQTQREEVLYGMLISGLWLAAKHTLLHVYTHSHTQLRAYRFFQQHIVSASSLSHSLFLLRQ